MATYGFYRTTASLKITDTPVGYTPPYGFPVDFTVTYAQRTTSQPATFTFPNFGPKWNCNWLSYIIDDPTDTTLAVAHAVAGGGRLAVDYAGEEDGYQYFRILGKPARRLRRSNSGALAYELVYPDGSRDVFGQSDGSTTAPRRVFLTQRIDPAGNAATLTYDPGMRITKITDALGQITTLDYGLAGDPLKITKVTDPFGRFATFGYDGSGRLDRITDVIGIQSIFTYEGTSDFINSLTTPYGTTAFSNSVTGSITQVSATDPQGDTEVMMSNTARYEAVPFSEEASAVPVGMAVLNDELDTRNTFYWDKKAWKEAPNDHSSAHRYHWLQNADLQGMGPYLASEKPPMQSRIWYSYPEQTDLRAVPMMTRPSRIGRAIEGGTQLYRRDFNFLGKVTGETDPVGRTTRYIYSPDGIDLLEVRQQTSQGEAVLASYNYNSQHRPISIRDAAGQATTCLWNVTGQIVSFRNAKNETTIFNYWPVNAAGRQRKGRLQSIDGALPGTTDTVTFDYDSTGNLSDLTGPDGYFLRYTYDTLDRLTRVTYPDNTFTETTYYRLDPQTSRDRLGRMTTYVYNSIRQLESVTDPANRTIGYRWCKCGALSQIIDAMGRITKWKHDVAGRMTAKEYVDGSKITYLYERLSGRVRSIIDEKGQMKTRTYNLDNTLAGLSYTNEEHETPDVAFTYDSDFQRLKTMMDGIGTTFYAYNPVATGTLGAGQLASVDGPLPNDTLTCTYDELERRTGYAINDAGETRDFDSLGRLRTVTNALGVFGYTYVDSTDRMDTVTYPNGITCQYNYHPLNGDFRLKDIVHTLSGGTLLSRHSYSYNIVGNITRWTQISAQAGLNRSWLCGYDDADQLTSVASQDPVTFVAQPTGQYSYSYDKAGNRLTESIDGVTATANNNALNQLTHLTGGASSIPQHSYEWDAEGRLTAINYSDSDKRTEIKYDGLKRMTGLIEKRGADMLQHRVFVWDGPWIAEERAADGTTVTKRYLHNAMQFFDPSSPAPEARFHATDHLGSIGVITDSTGNEVGAFSYDAYGRRSQAFGPAGQTDLGFTGHWVHEGSGLSMALYRTYSPALGRWLSRDPLTLAEVLPEGPNLYGYVGNDPINGRDALGLRNRLKSGVAIINAWRSGGLYVSGGIRVGAGGAALFTGVGTLPGIAQVARGAFDLWRAENLRDMARQQWDEAMTESWEDESLRNLLGLLPFGSKFDDPCEPWPLDFLPPKVRGAVQNGFESFQYMPAAPF